MTTKTFAGVYQVPEAARYLYVTSHLPGMAKPTPRHLLNWMHKGIAPSHLIHERGRNIEIDFQDLISMRVIYLLRGMGVGLDKIRIAKAYLEELTGHSHPFATERLWTETIDIFAEIGPLLVTASKSGQLPFLELVRQDLVNVHDMTFSHGVADSWSPQLGILLKPNIQFGAPCIAKTGYPTRSIWRMYLGGDTVPFLAQSYDLGDPQIENALRWEENLAKVTFTRTAKTPTLLGG
ncbi:MAG: DUF433 domain-containing protein [Dehalococcoidia bacterium]